MPATLAATSASEPDQLEGAVETGSECDMRADNEAVPKSEVSQAAAFCDDVEAVGVARRRRGRR